jgi:putative SOS response-associated peptidase YedK
MCSRYSQARKSVVLRSQSFGNREFEFVPRYNISPGQQVDVVHIDRGSPASRQMRWGWHHKKFGSITTVSAHQSYHVIYKEPWKTGRCLIPADGYYQWRSGHPYRVVMVTGKPFWFAGLYQEGEVLVLAGPAFGWLVSFDREQPIALSERELDWWLGDTGEYRGHEGWAVINRAISVSAMEAYPVAQNVSDPIFESPECVEHAQSPAEICGQFSLSPRPVWHPAGEPPLPGKAVDILLADDTVTHGEWDGRGWTGLRFGNSCPVRWRRQSGPLSMNGNARSA